MTRSAKDAAPLYVQAREALMSRIVERYRPGQLLPTQQELATDLGVSLITIKRALSELGRLGVVESTRGRGTVVVRPTVQPDQRGLASWTDFMTGVGREPRTAWTRLSVRVPTAEVARRLRLKSRGRTVRVERLRSLDGTPFCLMTNELPLALVPELPERGLTEESLYGCLQHQYGLAPRRAEEEVDGRLATGAERQALGLDTEVVLIVRRLALLEDGRPLEYAEMTASARRYRYRITLEQA